MVVRIESGIDRAASALFAAACGYAAFTWFSPAAPAKIGAESIAAGGVAYLIALRALSAVRPAQQKVAVPIFDVRDVEPMLVPAPLLTHRVEEPRPAGAEEALVLDDILAKLGPDSRVVRLFDPAAMPTAGELQSRIDRHLDDEASAQQDADAAQALHDALAELRRSIR
ncbi:MAG TPA: hypothetical protein VH392_10895 [Sphingomicrobium sp.]